MQTGVNGQLMGEDTTRSQHFPHLAGQCLKKLIKRTFSSSRPQSSAILSHMKLFLKVMDFLVKGRFQKKKKKS